MLTNILNIARQESAQMRHYYIGAEHLFIAMLTIRGGITANIIQDQGFKPDYVIDALRRKIGKGGVQQTIPPGLSTYRADRILENARKLASKSGRKEPNERDLLLSLLRDGESLPIRVLRALGLNDIKQLIKLAQEHHINSDSQQPYVSVQYGPDFDESRPLAPDQLIILRRLFSGYLSIKVERYLTGGYSEATLLVITPKTGNLREDAPVVVKIDFDDHIQDEYQRYESHVRTKLPPLTARVDGRPVSSDMSPLAGIKYTIITDTDRIPRDLRAILHQWDGKTLGDWLERTLFPAFGTHWWLQNSPYRFQVWQEYDWLLPPILTLETARDDAPQTSIHIREPIRRGRLRKLEYGDTVTVENFVVKRVYPAKNAILLVAGTGTPSHNAFRIEIRNVDLHRNTHFRGEIIERITGTVFKTRRERLEHALNALEPYFNIYAQTIPVPGFSPERLPNPILGYDRILDDYLNGSLATIHGDLHPGNIMIGPQRSAFLIDFAHTREGHTLFDWANLETSLLCDLFVNDDTVLEWDEIVNTIKIIQAMNLAVSSTTANGASTAHPSLQPILHIRRIARQILTNTNIYGGVTNPWSEYYIAMAFCALRAMTRSTLSISARRLMMMVAALAIHEVSGKSLQDGSGQTQTPDEDPDPTNSF